MAHQSEVEKTKYRNWVRGALAYKYLRGGLEGFADEICQQEHNRILLDVNRQPGFICDRCDIKTLRPKHGCTTDPTGHEHCPWRLTSCNCMQSKKKTKSCRNNVCDAILEEIVKCHASAPLAPNFKNTDIQKWCSTPWEVAKCFIPAPGYRDKTNASDIDIVGLLHVFNNNMYFKENINNVDILNKVLAKRNTLFHSTTMELTDTEMNECIGDIITLLEDDKELKARNEAQQAVAKLKQLMRDDFIITTSNEAEVCRDALSAISHKMGELKQIFQDAKSDFDSKVHDANSDFDSKVHDTNSDFDSKIHNSNSDFCSKVHDANSNFNSKVQDANSNFDSKVLEANSNFDSRVYEANSDFDSKVHNSNSTFDSKFQKAKSDVVSTIHDAKSYIDCEICNAKSDIDGKILEAKSALRSIFKTFVEQLNPSNLQTREMKETIEVQKERIGQLELDKQRLTEIEANIKRQDACVKRLDDVCQKQGKYAEQKREMQRMFAELYKEHYVKTWVSPLKIQENDVNIDEIYVKPKMVVKEKTSTHNEYEGDASFSATKRPDAESETPKDISTENARAERPHDSKSREINRYQEIFQTNGVRRRKIYVVGDVGTGKSSFCKMMIYNWCRSFTDGENSETACLQTVDTSDDKINKSPPVPDDEVSILADNIKEMKQFEFLFFIPLQRMSGLTTNGVQLNDILEMIKSHYSNIASKYCEVLTKIFEEESERCLVIADGLDEWTPPKHTPSHVSYGIPVADRIQNATLVTLSRPSAKGMLNIRSSEYDQEIEILGVKKSTIHQFVKNYMSKLNRKEESVYDFRHRIRLAGLEKHEKLNKMPFLLQQLIYMYCTYNSVGKSVSDIYSNMVNIMLCWSRNKTEEDITAARGYVDGEHRFERMQVPKLLRRFPNCKANEPFLIILGKIAFDALTSDIPTSMFGRLDLQEYGLSNEGICKLTQFGILTENKSFDTQYENTCLSFIHTSYLEFFAAVYISCHYSTVQSHTLAQYHSEQSKPILEELFIRFKSAADILQLSLVFKMLCGLCPTLIGEISKSISDNVATDECLIEYRKSCYSRNTPSEHPGFRHASLVQTLIVDCLSQCGLDKEPIASLCDIIIDSRFNMSIISKLYSSDMVSVKYSIRQNLAKIAEWIAQLRNLQFVCIQTGVNDISCEKYKLLCSSLKQAMSLKHLSLTCSHSRCQYADSECHCLDLSTHDQLQSIQLRVDLVNTDLLLNLKTVEKLYIFDDRYLVRKTRDSSYEVSLYKNCNHTFCEGHSFDPSDQEQIQLSVSQYEELDRDISVFPTYDKSPEKASISDRMDLNHDFCERLALSVEKATILKHLELNHGRCNQENCKSHTIDLSGHDQLQSLCLGNNFAVSGINTDCLNALRISSLTDVNHILSVCTYSKLRYLQIKQLSTFTAQMNLAIQTLGQLQSLSLRFVDIDENVLVVTPEMENLSQIELDEVSMSLPTWHVFVDSILSLQQCVQVHASRLEVTESEERSLREYVENNEMFKVIYRSNRTFRFRSNK